MSIIFAEEPLLRHIYRQSFLLRFGVGMAAWLVTLFYPSMPLIQDGLTYDQLASQLASDWWAGRPSMVLEVGAGARAPGPIIVIAIVYLFTGGVRVLPLVLAFYSAITAYGPVLTYKIARQLGASPAAAYYSAKLIIFSPVFLIWSALYKEGVIYVVLNLVVYHILLLQEKWQPRSLLIIVACMPALFALRFYLAAGLAPVVALGLLFGRVKTRADLINLLWVILRQIVIVGGLIFLLGQVGFFDRLQADLPANLEDALAKIQITRFDLANSATSGYLPNADVSTPEGALKFLPSGLLYFLTVPFPWQLGSMRQNITIPETAFWVLLYPLMLSGMKRGLNRNYQGSLLMIAMTGSICLLYALFMGNIGTAYRMRSQVWLLWAVFAGLGWEQKYERRLAAWQSKQLGGHIR